MLTLRRVRFSRDFVPLFRPVEVTLPAGTALWVQGPNGVGKTTLLKLIAGLLRPEAGTITWQDAQDPQHWREVVGWIGCGEPLKPILTVEENARFLASLHGSLCEDTLETALRHFDLWPVRHRPAGQLSAGMRRRLLLTQLMTVPARLWLLDEPQAMLDRAGLDAFHAALKQRLTAGDCAVVAAHHPPPPDLPVQTLTLEAAG